MMKNNDYNIILKLPWTGYSVNLIEYFSITDLEVIDTKNEKFYFIFKNRETEFHPEVITSVIYVTQILLDNK